MVLISTQVLCTPSTTMGQHVLVGFVFEMGCFLPAQLYLCLGSQAQCPITMHGQADPFSRTIPPAYLTLQPQQMPAQLLTRFEVVG